MSTPNQRTALYLRRREFYVEQVEQRVAGTFRTRDLFGAFDQLAVGHGITLAIQTTSDSGGNFANRRKRLLSPKVLPRVLACVDVGWRIEAWAWGRGSRDLKRYELCVSKAVGAYWLDLPDDATLF